MRSPRRLEAKRGGNGGRNLALRDVERRHGDLRQRELAIDGGALVGDAERDRLFRLGRDGEDRRGIEYPAAEGAKAHSGELERLSGNQLDDIADPRGFLGEGER